MTVRLPMKHLHRLVVAAAPHARGVATTRSLAAAAADDPTSTTTSSLFLDRRHHHKFNDGVHLAITPPLLLLRDFIAASLAAYFCTAAHVGSGAGLPPLPSLADRAAYTRAVAGLYAAQPPGAWLTPSELFSPHYGSAVAAWLLDHHASHAPPGSPLHIVEIGSGRGTLARDVLNAIRESGGESGDRGSGGTAGSLYSRTVYATLDVSPGLAEVARGTVGAAGHGPAVFRQARGDACEAGGWGAAAAAALEGGCRAAADEADTPRPYILACELLDNLPHDRVERMSGDGGQWAQSMVRWGGPGSAARPTEELRPLADPVIVACLAAALEEEGQEKEVPVRRSASFLARLGDFALGEAPPPWAPPRPTHPSAADCLFLPTGAARFLAAVDAAFPAGSTLLALDFDALPTGGSSGGGGRRRWRRGRAPSACWGAPLVSGPPAPGAPAVDYPHILDVDPPGTADIFFPTDFHLIARLARRAAGEGGSGCEVSTRVVKSAAFMRAHSPNVAACATASGWNPLVDDFTNTSALVVERRRSVEV